MNAPRPKTAPRVLWLAAAAALLLPLCALALLEVSLRAFGFGFPTRFFIAEHTASGHSLRTNHQFTHQFFPPALARGILPHRIAIPKPHNHFRIILFGESAANGDPDPAYGFGRHLEFLLEGRFPSTDFEVICTAITAINSHVILDIARDCTQLDADLWLVYMGNNEVIGPYGSGTIFGSQAPPRAIVRANIALKSTRIGQLLSAAVGLFTADATQAQPNEWAGINMFADNTLPFNAPARARVLTSFDANLDALLNLADRAAVPVLLSTIASNLRDCGPFASVHAEPLSTDAAQRWRTAMTAAENAFADRTLPAAISALQDALAIDPFYAETHFRLGQALLANGQPIEAKAAFSKARDFDALAVRADSRINRSIANAAKRRASADVHFIDLAAHFAQLAEDGIPGRALFFEHVHFTPTGNAHAAQAFAEAIVPLLPPAVRQDATNAWPTFGQLRASLALTLWDQHRLYADMQARLASPPYNQRLQADEAIALCQQQADWLQQRIDLSLDRRIYQRALTQYPDDYHLLTRFGYFLLDQGDFDAAIDAFSSVRDRFPFFDGGHQDLGLALLLAGRTSEARDAFAKVLALRPGYPRALKALELIDATPAN